MRVRLTNVLGMCLIATAAVAEGPCSDKDNTVRNDGVCWNSFSGAERGAVVRGLWTGMAVGEIGRALTGNDKWIYGLDPTSVPDQTTIGDIWDYFDKLYESPANRKIRWEWAYVLAALNARDDDSNDRLALLGYLREHERLPTNGEIQSVKDAETLVIRSDGATFEIRLAGISVPNATASKSKALLSALAVGQVFSFGDCKSPTATYVTLAYSSEFFDEDKRLVALVRIPSYETACAGTEAVSIHADSTDFTNLSFYLVGNGLAVAKPATDGLWSADRRKLSEGLLSLEDKAKAAGLYLHGTNTIPVIEKLTPAINGSSL